jgi:hypothetical protein
MPVTTVSHVLEVVQSLEEQSRLSTRSQEFSGPKHDNCAAYLIHPFCFTMHNVEMRQLSPIQYKPSDINDICVAIQPGGTAPHNLGSLYCHSFRQVLSLVARSHFLRLPQRCYHVSRSAHITERSINPVKQSLIENWFSNSLHLASNISFGCSGSSH